MGFVEALFGKDNPGSQFVAGNRNAIRGFGAGLARGNTFSEGLSQGAQLANEGAGLDDAFAIQQEAEAGRQQQILDTTAKRNDTLEFLRTNAPDYYEAVNAGAMSAGDAWKAVLQQREGGTDAAKFGLNPIYGTDAQGNPALGQLSNAGGFEQTQLPEGFNISRDPIKMDAGTHFVLLDPITREPIGQVPKNNQQAAFDKALGTVGGKTQGDLQATTDSLRSKMPGLRTVVDELGKLADEATYTVGGQLLDEGRKQLGLEPTGAGIARAKYIAMVDNQVLPLLRDTFGAAFTEKEGAALRATLGDPNKSPAEKKAVLDAFISQKERDLQGFDTQLGAPQPGGVSGQTSSGVQWSVE